MLKIRGIFCHFGGLVALDNVSLDIGEKELVGLMGPNGAGKTTLFNIISGFIPPTRGNVYLKGEKITGLPPHIITRKGLVRTFQNVRIFEHLSVIENVEVAVPESRELGIFKEIFPTSKIKGMKKLIKERAFECISLTGLKDMAFKDARSLTFGQQRLLGIARAVASRPQILLLDEPSAGLNEEETWTLSSIIKRIYQRGVTIFIIEHDIPMLLGLTQRIIVLDKGRKIMEGPPEKIKEEKLVIEAYFGGENRCLV